MAKSVLDIRESTHNYDEDCARWNRMAQAERVAADALVKLQADEIVARVREYRRASYRYRVVLIAGNDFGRISRVGQVSRREVLDECRRQLGPDYVVDQHGALYSDEVVVIVPRSAPADRRDDHDSAYDLSADA